MSRDRGFERAMLELAAVAAPVPAGGSPFVAHAVDRLELGDREYGESWARRPLAELLNELLEEAADLGAWAVLTLQSLGGLDPARYTAVEAAVLDAARAGARAHSAVLCALQEITGPVPPVGLSTLVEGLAAAGGSGRGPGGRLLTACPGTAPMSRDAAEPGRRSDPTGRDA
jgi:hypothetical protein